MALAEKEGWGNETRCNTRLGDRHLREAGRNGVLQSVSRGLWPQNPGPRTDPGDTRQMTEAPKLQTPVRLP